MNNRIWIIGTALLSVAVIALGWFLGIAPKLAESSVANLQRMQIDGQNAQYATDLAALKLKFESIDKLRAELDTARLAVPNNDETDKLYDELLALTDPDKVIITNLSIDEPVAYTGVDPLSSTAPGEVAPVDPVVAPEGADAVDATPVDPAVVAEGTDVAGETATSTSTSPLVTTTNFYSMKVTIEIKGKSPDATGFLNALQTNDRLFAINHVLDKDEKDLAPGYIALEVTGLIFILNDGTDGIYNAGPVVEEPAEEVPTATETPAPTETPVP